MKKRKKKPTGILGYIIDVVKNPKQAKYEGIFKAVLIVASAVMLMWIGAFILQTYFPDYNFCFGACVFKTSN
jgi:uncharacterized membrane-anchored protein